WTCKNGGSFGLLCGVGPAGQKLVPGQNHRVDAMAATGLYEDGKKGVLRPSTPALRAKDMDRDGVQAEVIFGILGAATRLNDHEAATVLFRIYNDWLVDFCKHDPTRFIGLACLPYGDIDAAVKEIPRRADGPARHGAVVLVGHGAHVASGLGAALAGRERRESPDPLPHLPVAAAERDRAAEGPRPPRGVFQRGLELPAESGKYHLRRDRPRDPRALSERPHLLRRERYRLDPVRARSHGLRVGGPLPRPRAHDEAERLLAAPVQGDVPVRPDRHQAHRGYGRGDADVGLGLSASRRRLA